jgi:hypothetical protein
MEELKLIASSFEEEFKLHTNIIDTKYLPPCQSFEIALAESRNEEMQDNINALTSRIEELEEKIDQQNIIIELLQHVNNRLSNNVDINSSTNEIDELNELFQLYKEQSKVPNMSPAKPAKSYVTTPTTKKMQSQLKLQIQVGELTTALNRMKKALEESHITNSTNEKIIAQLDLDKNEEKTRRLHAEKQR